LSPMLATALMVTVLRRSLKLDYWR